MKSSGLIILATLLATAILAPSVITLTNLSEKTAISIDFNEEEKKEENKEVKEKDFFLNSNFIFLSELQSEKVSISRFYIESEYVSDLAIFLPPPKYIL